MNEFSAGVFLTVGEIAARSGIAVSALHFYEAQGLIRSIRSAGNQRRFPRGVLRRGYAWLSTEAGQPLLSAAQARPGQVVMAHLTDGRLRTEVRDVLADADDPAGGEG